MSQTASRRARKADVAEELRRIPHSSVPNNPPPAIPPAPSPDASPMKSTASRLSILPFLSRARTKSVSSSATDTETESLPPPHTYHGYTTHTDYSTQSTKIPAIHSSNSTSLGSKLVAHLAPLKHRRSMRQPPAQQLNLPSSYDHDHSASKETLIPPTPTPRSPSSESTRSRMNGATPQPTITVSHPMTEREDLKDFSDLFFSPAVKKDKKRATATSETDKVVQHQQRLARTTDHRSTSSPVATRTSLTPASKIALRKKAEDAAASRKSADDEKSLKAASAEKWRSLFSTEALSMTIEPAQRSTKSLEQSAPPVFGPSPELPIRVKPPGTAPSVSLKARSVRRRAQTLSAASAPPPSSPLPPSPALPSTPTSPTLVSPNSLTSPSPSLPDDLLKNDFIDKESLDYASPEKLREMLLAQIVRCEQLAAYVTTVTDMHAAEKSMLEQRIELLERDAKVKEREVKGLRWMVMNGRGGGPTLPSSSASVRSAPVTDNPSRLRNPSAHFVPSAASNSESESGFSSSGLTPILRKKKPAASQLSPSPAGQAVSKRASVSSFASTGTAASVNSNPGLTAIPESPPFTRTSHDLTTPPSSDLESEQRKTESVASKLPHRLSVSSTSSVGSGLQFSGRSRPSSIAQVLQQSSASTIPRKFKNPAVI